MLSREPERVPLPDAHLMVMVAIVALVLVVAGGIAGLVGSRCRTSRGLGGSLIVAGVLAIVWLSPPRLSTDYVSAFSSGFYLALLCALVLFASFVYKLPR